MTQGILITAYKNIDQLIELTFTFNSNFNIYIHIDKKTELTEVDIERIKKNPIVKIVSQRYRVNWGGINHLKSYLYLSRYALDNFRDEVFHLITAQDLPVKSMSYFHEFLMKQQREPKDYIIYNQLPYREWSLGGLNRLEYYHLYDYFNAKKHIKFIRLLVKLQIKLGVKRFIDRDFPILYGGSTYWTLTRSTLNYVINFTNQKPEFLNRFKFSFCAEELYFQTVILNSNLKCKLVNDNLRYIDWSKGRGSTPAILDDTDFEKIIQGDYLFARKFGHQSNTIKNRLLNFIATDKMYD